MEYLTIQETMKRLNISRQSVYNAIERGALTGYKKYGKTLLDAEEVANYCPNNYRDKRQGKQKADCSWPVVDTNQGEAE